MNVSVLLVALMSLSTATEIKLYLPDIESSRPGVDVEHYRFEISLSDSTDEMHARAEVTIRFTKAVDSFFLDLIGRAGGQVDGADGVDGADVSTGMTVEAVRSGDGPVTFEHSDDRLTIMTGSVADGDRRTYTILYHGIPGDGLIVSANKFGERTFFGDNWPNRARHWLPTVDHVSDKAFVEWVVTAPDHYRVIANGELVEETHMPGGGATTHWRSRAPLSTKIMVIGVARFAVQHLEPVDGIPIQTWVYPDDRESGFYDFAVGIPMMRYFISQIGEFPYAKLANVESTTRYGGMENASAIFYAEQGVTGTRQNEATVAHEIAHQWFGDSVTEKDWHHIWLSEGFATYFTDLYWEHTYGRDEMEARLKSERQTVISYHSTHPDAPLVDSRIEDPNLLLNANPYQKGGWVLHMLRNEIGMEDFWTGIREYYRRFRDSNALTEDLRDVMEEASGKELDGFFQQWVYRTGQPDLAASWTYDREAGQVIIQIDQRQEDVFTFSLEIGITDGAGNQTFERVFVTEASHSFMIEVDEAPHVVELDPNTNLLFAGTRHVAPGTSVVR